jgi:hypothetical protein
MVCFFFDKEDYADEIKDLRAAARRMAYRSSLRLAMVTDKKLIKSLKK